jgi:hypothetical protein
MARQLTAQEHAEAAANLLDESRTKGIASPARSVILAEAQVHATLALVAYAAPAILHVPESLELSPEELQSLASSRLVVTTDPAVTLQTVPKPAEEPAPKPATKRRTRKAPASPASEEEAAQ